MFYSQFDLFLAKKLSLHDVILSYFKMGYQKKDTKRSAVAQWSQCFRPTLSAWELRRQRNVPKSVLEDEVSDFMSIWRYVTVGGTRIWSVFFKICKWSLGSFIEIVIFTWFLEDCKYTSYQHVWKIKIAKQTDGAGWHVSSAHAFFLAMDVVDISIPYTLHKMPGFIFGKILLREIFQGLKCLRTERPASLNCKTGCCTLPETHSQNQKWLQNHGSFPIAMWSSFCTSEKPKHERPILSWAPNDPLTTSLILWVDHQKEASLKRRYQIFWVHPGRHLVRIPALKSLIIPRICQNKNGWPISDGKDIPESSPRSEENFSTDFPTKGQRVCQNIGEGQVEHGGNRMDSNLTDCCWWIRNSKGAGVWQSQIVSCLKVLYMTSYFLILSLFCWATWLLKNNKQEVPRSRTSRFPGWWFLRCIYTRMIIADSMARSRFHDWVSGMTNWNTTISPETSPWY